MNLFKATTWTVFVYLALPLIFFTNMGLEMQLPTWDTDDSGAVQGFAFFMLLLLFL